jgi:hypothetical protein
VASLPDASTSLYTETIPPLTIPDRSCSFPVYTTFKQAAIALYVPTLERKSPPGFLLTCLNILTLVAPQELTIAGGLRKLISEAYCTAAAFGNTAIPPC